MGGELKRGTLYHYSKRRDPETNRVRSIYRGRGERGEATEREDLARSTTAPCAEIRTHKKRGPKWRNFATIKRRPS
jgi:hypothetical protein